MKDLDIVIDSCFKFEEHLGASIEKALEVLFIILRAVNCTDPVGLVCALSN